MQFKAIEPNIEIIGQALSFTIAGFRIMPSVGMRYLEKFNLTRRGVDGKPKLELDGWYPQQSWLDCFAAIYREVGANTTMEMGRQLGMNYPVPDNIKDPHAAMKWLDPGYHLAHRKKGRPMFNPVLGDMAEGIGHYGYRRDGERDIRSTCDNPYPCDFDLGLLTGMMQRFAARARVTHAEGKCRKSGADSCTYHISW